MNLLLKKSLLVLALFSFLLTFGISFHTGNSVVSSILRGSIALVVVGFLGSFVMKSVFRDIAFELLEFEKKQKDEKEKKQFEEAESVRNKLDKDEIAESEEKITDADINK